MSEPTPIHPSLPGLRYPDGELEDWFVLGDTTDRSVRVWARNLAAAVDASLFVDGREVATARIEPDPERDNVGAAVLGADGSRAETAFEVRVGGQVRRGQFAPEPGAPSSFAFAFGSCHQPFTDALDDGIIERHPGAAIYPRINRLLADRGAAFAMWLGDQVYSDAIAAANVRETLSKDPTVTDEVLVEAYRHLYRGYFNERGYRQLAEVLPAYLMWDDHDIYDGWGSLIDRSAFDERVFRAAERAYLEYQHLRNPGGSLVAKPPFGYSFWRGDVGFHVPDLRGERDFTKGRIMDVGWALLDAFLEEATEREVPTVFIGLSVPAIHASPALMHALERLHTSSGRDVRDRWSVPTFEGERTKLFERLFAWQSAAKERQVIVLSGDVHVGAAFSVRPRKGSGHILQWTSSALSTPDGFKHVVVNELITRFVRFGEHEVRVWRRGLATSNNVGVVDVKPAPDGGHVVSLSVHGYDAKTDKLEVTLTDEGRPS